MAAKQTGFEQSAAELEAYGVRMADFPLKRASRSATVAVANAVLAEMPLADNDMVASAVRGLP